MIFDEQDLPIFEFVVQDLKIQTPWLIQTLDFEPAIGHRRADFEYTWLHNILTCWSVYREDGWSYWIDTASWILYTDL